MNEINAMINGMLGFATDPFIMIIIAILGVVSIALYLAFINMKNNPYLIDTLMKRYAFNMVKKKYKIITVNYLRVGHNNNIIIQAIRRELQGKHGLYLEYIDEVVNIPAEYFITGAGEDDILYYVLTETGVGYPIKMELIKELDESDESKQKYKSNLVGLLASKKKHDLFTSHHFKMLAQGVKSRAGRGKSQFDRLLESGIPAVFIITIAFSFLLMYNFAVSGTKDINKSLTEYTQKAFKLQNSFMERDRYCQVFISRYGTQDELDKYLSMPTGFEEFSEE